MVRNFVYFYYAKKGLKPSVPVLLISQIVILVSAIFTWQNALSLLPLSLALTTGWGLWQSNMKYSRRTLLFAKTVTTIYNFAAGAYTGMIESTFEAISITVAMWRLDRKPKKIDEGVGSE